MLIWDLSNFKISLNKMKEYFFPSDANYLLKIVLRT